MIEGIYADEADKLNSEQWRQPHQSCYVALPTLHT